MELQPIQPPFWKLAVQKFLESGFVEGDVVSHSWLYRAFGISEPQPDTPLAEAERSHLLYVRGTTKLIDALCVDHQIHLRNVAGEGYRLVPLEKQAHTAFSDGIDMVRKGLRHVTKRLANMDLQALSDAQRAEHADLCARISKFKSLSRSLRRQDAQNPPLQLTA